jgi:hypothetical protein
MGTAIMVRSGPAAVVESTQACLKLSGMRAAASPPAGAVQAAKIECQNCW